MKAIITISLTILVCSCGNWKHAYTMDAHDKETQKGFHAISANKIISQNQKNRKTNIKAAEKKRLSDNKSQAALNESRTKKHTKPSGVFKFYVY